MKNVIIAILVALLIVAGFMIAAKKKANVVYEPWPETEPANPTTPKPKPATPTPTQSAPTTNQNNTPENWPTKTYSKYGFKMDYPSDIVVHEEQGENGPYLVVSFGSDATVVYVTNADFHEQYAVSDYEYLASRIVNGNTIKTYQTQESYGSLTRHWLRVGNVGYEISFGDNSRMSLDTFDLIN